MTPVHAVLAAALLLVTSRGQVVQDCVADCFEGVAVFAPPEGNVFCICCISQAQVARCDYVQYTCRPLGAGVGSQHFRIIRPPDWSSCMESPASTLPICTFPRPAPVFEFAPPPGGHVPADPGGNGGHHSNVNPADGEAENATRDKLIGAAAGGAIGGAILLAALATLCFRRCLRGQDADAVSASGRRADGPAADDDNQTIPSFGFRGNGEDYDPFSAPQPSPFQRPQGASDPYLPETASQDGTIYPPNSVSPTLRGNSTTPIGLQKWSDLPKLPKFDFEDE